MVNAPVSGVVVTFLTSWRFLGSSPRFVVFMFLKYFGSDMTHTLGTTTFLFISQTFHLFPSEVTLSQSSFYYVISLIDVWDSDWWCIAVHNLWSQSLHFISEYRVFKEIQSHRWNGWQPFAAVFAVVHRLKKWLGCADTEVRENFSRKDANPACATLPGASRVVSNELAAILRSNFLVRRQWLLDQWRNN